MVHRPLLLLVAVGCFGLGCAQPGSGENAGGLFSDHSPLRPLALPGEGVALDIVFVRRPLGDPQINEQLRAEVDELVLEASLRDSLEKNGFWVATSGDPLPRTLESVLGLDKDEGKENEGVEEDEEATSASSTTPDADVLLVPRVTRQWLMLRSGTPTEILTRNGPYAECFIPYWQQEQWNAVEFKSAQCVLVVTPHLEEDGRVRIKFLPQIRYGTARVEHEATLEGTWRFASRRPRRSFEELAWQVTLAKHEMALFSCLPEPEGSLGYHFFTTPAGDTLEQNLIVVRVSDTEAAEQGSFVNP